MYSVDNGIDGQGIKLLDHFSTKSLSHDHPERIAIDFAPLSSGVDERDLIAPANQSS